MYGGSSNGSFSGFSFPSGLSVESPLPAPTQIAVPLPVEFTNDTWKVLRRELYEYEKRLIKLYENCDPELRSSIVEKFSSIIPENLVELVTKEYYDVEVMIFMSCLIQSLTSSTGVAYNELLRRYIVSLYRLSSGASGEAFAASFGNKGNNLFVLKSALPEESESLVHETTVGLYGTNRFRSAMPNFAYVYGWFTCGMPVTNSDKNVITYCGPTSEVAYVVYENIAPSVTFRQFLQTATQSDFIMAYLQVLLALDYANRINGFTHYDLHDNNFLIRRLPTIFSLAYPQEDGITIDYITTDKIATIIDYGYAHIRYQDTDIGVIDASLVKLDVQNNSHPFHDAFKLLGYSAYTAHTLGNNAVLVAVEILLVFFGISMPIAEFIARYKPRYFTTPRTAENSAYRHRDLIDYIKKTFQIDTSAPGSVLFSCADLECKDMAQIQEISGLGRDLKLETPSQYYDFINTNYDSALLPRVRESLVANQDQLLASLNTDIENLYTQLEARIARFKTLDPLLFKGSYRRANMALDPMRARMTYQRTSQAPMANINPDDVYTVYLRDTAAIADMAYELKIKRKQREDLFGSLLDMNYRTRDLRRLRSVLASVNTIINGTNKLTQIAQENTQNPDLHLARFEPLDLL